MTETIGLVGQAQRMQAALSPVLMIGPDFLAGRRDADDMAHTMVRAVQEYADEERARQQAGTLPEEDSVPSSADRAAEELYAALAEVYTCGSGYLANRCDSDCVVRTMTQIMGEFGDPDPGR
ncbi:MAG: hypothetical protein ABI065_07580 [Terrimesophilobacter sp.]